MIQIGNKVEYVAIDRGTGTVVDINGETADVSWPGFGEPIRVDLDRLRAVSTTEAGSGRVREFLEDAWLRVETIRDDYLYRRR